MNFIFDVLSNGNYPFLSSIGELPTGYIGDIFAQGVTELYLTDVVKKGDNLFLGFVDDAGYVVFASIDNPMPGVAYPLKTDSETIGKIELGPAFTQNELALNGLGVAVVGYCLAKNIPGLAMLNNGQLSQRISIGGSLLGYFNSSNNIIKLARNEVVFELNTPPTTLKEDGGYVARVGEISGDNISIAIDGVILTPVMEASGVIALKAENLTLPGCEETSILDHIKCSTDDGAQGAYPLDEIVCPDVATTPDWEK